MNEFLNIKIHNSWNDFLSDEIRKELNDIYLKIKPKLFFPKTDKVLRFLELDLFKIKYIIVGMEPYPSFFEQNNEIIPEATGRSFEVQSILDKTWQDKFKQSSLRNILKTIYYNDTGKLNSLEYIRNEIRDNNFIIKKPKEWFNSLENQGVLFLNASLTVEANIVDSHCLLWENFMNKLINYIYENNKNITYLLWGKKAQDRILNISNKNNLKIKYLNSCHPRLSTFVEKNCFLNLIDINWKG